MRNPTALATILLAAAAILCGCTSAPSTPVHSSAPGAAAPDRYGAPVVEHPRDLSGRDQQPCELLTPAQLTALHITTPGQASSSALGTPRCTWEDRNTDQRVSLVAFSHHDLFVDAYRTHILPLWHPGTIDGLPVLYEQTTAQSGNCVITVGVAVGQAFEVSFDRLEDGAVDPCDGATRVVHAIITNLPSQ